jgi:carnitine monooxygenase subunit
MATLTLDKDSFAPGFTDDPGRSFTPDGPYFYSPRIYDAEQRFVFFKSWLFFCHESELPNPGDYRVGEVAGQSIFLLRGQDGQLRGFFNVCRHRASQLLQGSGTLKGAIRCPYHSWTYDSTGRLRHAPHCESVAGFQKDAISLAPIRTETVGGFVFVNLDPNAKPLDEDVPGFRKALLEMCPEAARLKFAALQHFDIQANWKVVAENFLENYHSFYSGRAHAQLSDIIDQESYEIVAEGKRIEFRGKGGPQEKIPYRMLPERSFSGRPEGFQILFLWPCAAFLLLPGADVLLVFLMNPAGPERTSEPLLYYTLDGKLDPVTKSAVDWFNDVLGPEDVELVENVQRGLHSLAYKNGRLMSDPEGTSVWGEHILHHFNRLVIEAITRG